MSKNNFSKRKFSDFLMSKSFYVVLALCIVGAGATAWVAANRTLVGLQEQNAQMLDNTQTEEEIVWETPQTPVGDTLEDQPKPSSSSSQSSSSSSWDEPSSQPSASSEQAVISPTPLKSESVLPVAGEVISVYSDKKLVRNETLGDWRTHDGVDFKAAENEDVVAIQTGTVLEVSNDPLWGWSVELDHGDGVISTICGLTENVSVTKGERVSAGQVVGRVGQIPCEIAMGSHIHLSVTKDGEYIDPLVWMDKV